MPTTLSGVPGRRIREAFRIFRNYHAQCTSKVFGALISLRKHFQRDAKLKIKFNENIQNKFLINFDRDMIIMDANRNHFR